eukprot:scaffold3826_cov407-Prasinococcus_capsulatus_cf.AAC.4
MFEVEIKKWHTIASWSWGAGDDVCGICRIPYEGCAPEAKVAYGVPTPTPNTYDELVAERASKDPGLSLCLSCWCGFSILEMIRQLCGGVAAMPFTYNASPSG